jgi:hypothetical protein
VWTKVSVAHREICNNYMEANYYGRKGTRFIFSDGGELVRGLRDTLTFSVSMPRQAGKVGLLAWHWRKGWLSAGSKASGMLATMISASALVAMLTAIAPPADAAQSPDSRTATIDGVKVTLVATGSVANLAMPANAANTYISGGYHFPPDNVLPCSPNFKTCFGTMYGQLMVYDGNTGVTWWYAPQASLRYGYYAYFQADGNLVVYANPTTPVWASNTCCHSGAYLAIQGDGNVVIYLNANTPVWATGTAHPNSP